MTCMHQSHSRASDVARACLRQAIRAGRPLPSFAGELVEVYHRLVPVDEREVEFHVGSTTDSIIKAARANAQIVQRIFDGTVRFPLDLVEAWGLALPEPYGLEFRRAMARRLGFVGVLPPSEQGAAGDVSALATEFGETMAALAPLLADGRIDDSDNPALVRKALREGTDLMAVWLALQQQLLAALPSTTQGST